MPLYTPPNLSGGIDDALVGTVTAVPSFTGWFLFFIFGVIFVGGITSQKRRLGSADIPMWSTIASMSTLVIALPLTITAGLLQLEVLSVIVAVVVLSGFWLFTDRNRNEV